MGIGPWLLLVTSLVIVVPCFAAKTFSLNEAIAKEAKLKRQLELKDKTTTLDSAGSVHEPISYMKGSPKRIRGIGTNFVTGKNPPISLAEQLRKNYKIKIPLKPKKIKLPQKLRQKRKFHLLERDIYDVKTAKFLKNIGLLVDNILAADNSDSVEAETYEYGREKFDYGKRNNMVCKCSSKSDLEHGASHQAKTTITSTTATAITTDFSTTVTPASSTTTVVATTLHERSLGQDTDLPPIPTRDPFSLRGDDSGLGEGSSTPIYSSIERDFTRDYRNSEDNTEYQQRDTANNEDNSGNYTRHSPSYDEHRTSGIRLPGYRDNIQGPIYRRDNIQNEKVQKNQSTEPTRKSYEFENENKLEIRGNTTNRTTTVPEYIREYRTVTTEKNNEGYEKSQKNYKKGDIDVTNDIANVKRLFDSYSTLATKDKKICSKDESITPPTALMTEVIPKKNKPMTVTIIDGYSIARDINGHKLTEKSIRFHS